MDRNERQGEKRIPKGKRRGWGRLGGEAKVERLEGSFWNSMSGR